MLFNTHTKNASFTGKVFTICQADKVLGKGEHAKKIAELKAKEMVSGNIFDDYYWHLLAGFFDYMQFLPDARECNAPLINVALAKLKLAFEHVLKHKDSRFQYAYVSLALLSGSGGCFSDYEVIISDKEGKPLDIWHPFVRGLSDYNGYFYKIRPHRTYHKTARILANPVLACKIMPESGLLFLKEDPVLFCQWLAALLGQDDSGDLNAALDISRAFPRSSMICQNLDPSLISEDMYGNAEAFWSWLEANLETGKNCSAKNGKITFDLDKIAKQYAENKQLNLASLKTRFKELNFAKITKSAEKSNYSISMFDSSKNSAKTTCEVIKSIHVKDKYYKNQSTINGAKDRTRSSLKHKENQSQQTT